MAPAPEGTAALAAVTCPLATRVLAGAPAAALLVAYCCTFRLRAGYFSRVSTVAYTLGLSAAAAAVAGCSLLPPVCFGDRLAWWEPAAAIAGLATSVYLLQRWRIFRFGRWPESWPYVQGAVKGEEFESLRRTFLLDCGAYHEVFDDFDLELLQAYWVKNPSLDAGLDAYVHDLVQRREKESNRRYLYHGTSKGKAQSILQHGFRLPYLGGWFGRGIYFADCPLNAAQYSRLSGCMLLCEVELGLSKDQFCMQDIAPETHLQQLRRLLTLRIMTGLRSFDSVRAVDDPLLGCVEAPEFVVYDCAQAVPRYVLIFKKPPRARAAARQQTS